MADCKPLSTPMEQNLKLSSNDSSDLVDATSYRQLVGSLIYATTTRPDISFSVGVLSRFMQQPRATHWLAAKRVLRYLQGTQNYGLKYSKISKFSLLSYSDSDYAGDMDDGKSTSGYLMSLGSVVISWKSKKQPVPTLSSAEAEYIAASEATREILWLRRILADLQEPQASSTPLFIDNQSTIKMAKNPVFHDRTKHINTKIHFIRHYVKDGSISLQYCATTDQPADILTKALGRVKFEKFREMIGLTPSD
ncbi:secreted RxLR effector protein 161-like [Cryptomeria japonica]|uniref:secreted RxLR effector protein 161-like n=1 Tax=Cryptomeria japonica TaxID=3369 RepID=UPI0027DA20B0|nr:secreted RxLR effector protein 161-like [Cryptomeria japonica]